ncbi:MAG TPA: hypothetical protein PLZ51_01615 [Aggregatilineales bacterium]|nr:hypothetical protein [Aggregatilineales bacterium]
MAYPPPQQNQPPYGQQPPPYQQPPYGQQPPPYGYQPQYPYQPPRNNNSGVIIALLIVVILVAGGVVAFVLLSNQGLCKPDDLAGTWYETSGLETISIRGNTLSASGSGLNFTGSYTCNGSIINWTLSNGQVTTLEILDKTSSTLRLKNAMGMISNYTR